MSLGTSENQELLPSSLLGATRLDRELQRPYWPALDGVRAVAAFLVVFGHMGWHWSPSGLGVLAFFVLSGFLITQLLILEEERFGSISLRLFYARRSLRIFPAFYVYWFLLVVPLVLFHKRLVIGQAIASFFYVNNYYQALFGDPQTGLSATWSLGVEEQFYLLWPFLFIALKTNARRLRFLLWAVPALWVYREFMIWVMHVPQGYVYEAFDMRADHLLIGCLLAVALRERAFTNVWDVLCRSQWMPWLTVGLLILVQIPATIGVHRYRDWAAFILEPVLIALLLPQLIAFRGGVLSRFLDLAWMRYLGRISYSIYLYQQLVIYPVEKFLRPWPALKLLGSVAAVVIAASASYFLIERPFLRWKDRFQPVSRKARSRVLPEELGAGSPVSEGRS
jgi:peptidoglycan/LPS O-acetylase OafA/YrhL